MSTPTPRRAAFTLVELLVSLAVGLAVVQIAFASFFIVRKYVNRIQRLEAATNLLQAAVTWYGFNSTTNLPSELQWTLGVDYVASFAVPTPAGEAKVRRLPHRIVANIDPGTGRLTLYDLSRAAQEARNNNDTRGITGWQATPPDPRILAEIDLQ